MKKCVYIHNTNKHKEKNHMQIQVGTRLGYVHHAIVVRKKPKVCLYYI